jgi:hypothetical protein
MMAIAAAHELRQKIIRRKIIEANVLTKLPLKESSYLDEV